MKDFFEKNKKKIIEVIIIILALIVLSFIALLLLESFGIVYYEDGVQLNSELFNKFKNSVYGSLMVVVLQVIITSLLSFVPGTSMAFILLLQALYNNPWQAFFISFSGVLLSSFMMYLIGRVGGYNICKKILGEKDCNKASDLLNNKGVIYFPIMMLFPVFPDDALIMIAGTLKMSLKWFIPSIVVCRGIGVATIIFGLASIPYDKFTTIWHWIIFIGLCLIGIFTVFYLAHRFNKHLEKKHNNEKLDVE